MKQKDNNISVIWNDAVMYTYGKDGIDLPVLETRGILVRQESDHILIKAPHTVLLKGAKEHIKKFENIQLLYIPKGMIVKMNLKN